MIVVGILFILLCVTFGVGMVRRKKALDREYERHMIKLREEYRQTYHREAL